MDSQEAASRTRRRIPEISSELIEWLRAVHPERCIGVDETLAQANRRAGTQDLITTLNFHSDLQRKAANGEMTPDDEDKMLYWEQDTNTGEVTNVFRIA